MKQEADRIATGPIVAAVVATIVLTAACIIWVTFVMGAAPPPGPVGQGAPAVDRTLYEDEGPGYAVERYAHKRAALNQWGWGDAQKKTVRMPIERAMKLVVERRP